ncbi:hypothetical protein BJ875DRAFT_446802 [Amylocarpus encephaloides]|uniref:Uncharacterized protein n=1 Tax=Amylocarpus encephaloides TaxID=45428 RepID=A0A9P7Y7E8_9HELO|nr:hypothetical protein BJ875DRAFT_446802 [Amylocarpus encephaloides]
MSRETWTITEKRLVAYWMTNKKRLDMSAGMVADELEKETDFLRGLGQPDLYLLPTAPRQYGSDAIVKQFRLIREGNPAVIPLAPMGPNRRTTKREGTALTASEAAKTRPTNPKSKGVKRARKTGREQKGKKIEEKKTRERDGGEGGDMVTDGRAIEARRRVSSTAAIPSAPAAHFFSPTPSPVPVSAPVLPPRTLSPAPYHPHDLWWLGELRPPSRHPQDQPARLPPSRLFFARGHQRQTLLPPPQLPSRRPAKSPGGPRKSWTGFGQGRIS